MKKLVLGAFAALLTAASFCGCGRGEGSKTEADTISLTGKVVIPDSLLRNPGGIIVGRDRIYISNGGAQIDSMIDEFTLDGKFVRRMLAKGQGPGELPRMDGMYYDGTANRIGVKSPFAIGKVVMLDSLDSPKPVLKTIVAMPEHVVGSPEKSVFTAQFFRMANGALVGGNRTLDGLLSFYSPTGDFVRYEGEYPDSTTVGINMPAWALENFFGMVISPTPDGRHFAATSKSGDIITFGTVQGDSISTVTLYGEPQEGIEAVNGDGWVSFGFNDKYRYFFPGGVRVSDSHAYTVVGGLVKDKDVEWQKMAEGEIPTANQIKVWDFDGNLVRVININVGRCLLAVSPDDTKLYALTESAENGYEVLEFDLPD